MRTPLSTILLVSLVTLLIPPVFAWEIERPSHLIMINKRTESAGTDGKASVGLGINVVRYSENYNDFPSYGGDYVDLRISATANTRNIISYWVSTDDYSWHDSLPYALSLQDQDDGGAWVWMGGIKVRFYGGPRSAEYNSVWITRNGLISFDPNDTSTFQYYPYTSFPAVGQPNTFVAPFWRDLKPGGSITYGTVWHWPGYGPNIECFAVSWNNVPDRFGNPQTFQVLMENAPTRDKKILQSRIWFQYNSITLNDRTTVGIEDQQGAKGVSYNYQSLSNGLTLLFDQWSNSALVGSLNIKLSESDPYASTEINTTPSSVRGYNVVLDQDLPDDEEQYYIALDGAQTLLFTALDLATHSLYVTGAGIIVDTLFITVDWARYMARQQALARLMEIDSVHAKAHGAEDFDGIFVSEAVDASFDILAYWIFTDQNSQNHILTVTSELTYVEYDAYGSVVATTTISTSQELRFNLYSDDSFDTAQTISAGSYSKWCLSGNDNSDFFKINVPGGYGIRASLYIPSDADFDMHLYAPSRTPVSSSTYRQPGVTETVSGAADGSTAGYWFIEMRKVSGDGFYSFNVVVYSTTGGGGGGGPPHPRGPAE